MTISHQRSRIPYPLQLPNLLTKNRISTLFRFQILSFALFHLFLYTIQHSFTHQTLRQTLNFRLRLVVLLRGGGEFCIELLLFHVHFF